MMLSTILVLFAIIPGFPTIPFLVLGLGAGVSGYLTMENEKNQKTEDQDDEMKSQAALRTSCT